ncbi:Hypothetical predicted protein [Mytilus galloprovincialis]|uniref:PKD domain-containing protein n=1 Tax=Mytilus galloprovincialis TaxID=29158 RepID=A0A8B6BTB9_MYTGA|nr:Hypothetical predicted protein [Mytilus galloprovincialis]
MSVHRQGCYAEFTHPSLKDSINQNNISTLKLSLLEGVYPVYVTAINPLGNTTSYLKEPFHVQRPPATPKLRENYYIQYGQNFTFKVEQIDDENITFDWKFGDQTDVVNSNSSEISHLYQNAGMYNLAVIANDRGIKNTASAKVYVQQKIQGNKTLVLI